MGNFKFLIHVLGLAALMLPADSHAVSAPGPVRPFVSDGCTLFRDGTPREPTLWYHCCYAHDLSIWAGGSRKLRDHADRELRACVADTGARQTAWVMYWAIRIGMRSPLKLKSKSWGNAWNKRPGYRPLLATEIDQIAESLSHSSVPPEYAQELLEGLVSDAAKDARRTST